MKMIRGNDMKVILHDLAQAEWSTLALPVDNNTRIIDHTKVIHPCVGCFGCWTKTPGQCVIQDEYQKIGALFGNTDELMIISRCLFGSYSSFIKNVIDRSIAYFLPFFEIRQGEMHHKVRYHNTIQFRVFFYGEDLSENEKKAAKLLVEANVQNFNGILKQVCFVDSYEKLKELVI